MNWSIIESHWPEYTASAKRRWDKLSEAQLTGTRGNREYLLKRVQEAYSLSRDEADRQLTDWEYRQPDRAASAPKAAR